MDEQLKAFIDRNRDAAMITRRKDGTAHMARIEVTLVDGRLWSSGGETLVRTRNLRRDPRCSLFVFAPGPSWVGLETTVTMLDGPESPDLHLRLVREKHKGLAPEGMVIAHDNKLEVDRPYEVNEYVDHIRAGRRLIYEFAIHRAYGNY